MQISYITFIYFIDNEILYVMHPGFGSASFLSRFSVIYDFVNRKSGVNAGLVTEILIQLRKINSWFRRQRRYQFYGSSILISYDAMHLKSQGDLNVRVRMIDFTHAIPNAERSMDTNYASGLNSLILLFEAVLQMQHTISVRMRE